MLYNFCSTLWCTPWDSQLHLPPPYSKYLYKSYIETARYVSTEASIFILVLQSLHKLIKPQKQIQWWKYQKSIMYFHKQKITFHKPKQFLQFAPPLAYIPELPAVISTEQKKSGKKLLEWWDTQERHYINQK